MATLSNTVYSWPVYRLLLPAAIMLIHRLCLLIKRFSACRVCTSPHVHTDASPPVSAVSLLVAVQYSDHLLSRETDLHLLQKPEAQVLCFTPAYPITGSSRSG